jgi:starvation-inducible DNA-binding protein
MNTQSAAMEDSPIAYQTSIELPCNERGELILLLNLRLASAIDLQMQMKQAHWNVKGPSFIALHKLFDEISEAVEGYVDLIAERIVQLGGTAEGTVRLAAGGTRLPEYPLGLAQGLAHVSAVAAALAAFGGHSRSTIGEAEELNDAVTSDLFTEVTRGIDQWLWFVEAHAQASS